MARKLAPDKWLFAATTGLALFGVVMVYSASAVIAERDNGNQFYYVIKQGVGGDRVRRDVADDAVQLSATENRRLVYGLLVLCTIALLSVFAFSPRNGAHRWLNFPGFSMQPSEMSKLALIIFLAYFLEKRAGEEGDLFRTFLPCGLVTGWLALLVVIEPDFGTAMMLVLIFTVVIYTAGARDPFGDGGGAGAGRGDRVVDLRPVAVETPRNVSRSVGRSAGRGISGGPVVDRGRIGWIERARFCAREAEDVVSSVCAFRFHLCGDRRRTRTGRRFGRRRGVRAFSLARRADGVARAGSIRNVVEPGDCGKHRGAGAVQHQRGAFIGADKRNSAAVHFVRRLFAGADACSGRDFAKRLAARERIIGHGTPRQNEVEGTRTEAVERRAGGWSKNAVLIVDNESTDRCRRHWRTHLSGHRGRTGDHAARCWWCASSALRAGSKHGWCRKRDLSCRSLKVQV